MIRALIGRIIPRKRLSFKEYQQAPAIPSKALVFSTITADLNSNRGTLLFPQECASNDVYTQQQALEFLKKKLQYFSAQVEKEGRSLGILRDVFITNIRVRDNNFRPKCIYVAVMLRHMMDAMLNKDAMDNKDSVGNKRLELSGQLLSLLFEDLFKTMNDEVRKTIDAILEKPSRSSRLDISRSSTIFSDATNPNATFYCSSHADVSPGARGLGQQVFYGQAPSTFIPPQVLIHQGQQSILKNLFCCFGM